MPDSTCLYDATSCFDATADTTAIIIIDSTTSDAENFSATVAYGLVSDFDGFMGPLGAKCDALGGQMDRIKDQISGIGQNYTPGGVFDNGVANGLNEAYRSSKWAQVGDAVDMAKNVLDKCSFFKEMAPAVPKYGDPFKQIKSLGKAAAEKAEAAADAAIDKIKNSTGYQFLEAQIGKSIAAITNTGRTVYDKVEGAVEDIGEAISPIIEYGKGAVSQTQTALSSATKELAKMDKLIECLNAVGGPDFSPQLDEMIDQMNCYYDKLGVFSDPALPNFGEFDVDNYINSIGSVHPEAAQNIKKSINMYSKAKNNAEGSIAKATDIAKKAKSASDPSATSQAIAQKKEAVSNNTKTVKTIPGIPGKTETKTVEVPAPEPIPKPELPDPPVPAEPKVGVSMWINETEVTYSNSEIEDTYNVFDPGHAHFNEFLSDGQSLFAQLEIEEPTETPDFKMTVELGLAIVGAKRQTDYQGVKQALLTFDSVAKVYIHNRTNDKIVFGGSVANVKNDQWTSSKTQLNDPEYRKPLYIKAYRTAIQGSTYTVDDIRKVL